MASLALGLHTNVLSDHDHTYSTNKLVKGVQTYVAMVILVAMHCWTRARPFGVKVEFGTSIYLIHHATFQCAR